MTKGRDFVGLLFLGPDRNGCIGPADKRVCRYVCMYFYLQSPDDVPGFASSALCYLASVDVRMDTEVKDELGSLVPPQLVPRSFPSSNQPRTYVAELSATDQRQLRHVAGRPYRIDLSRLWPTNRIRRARALVPRARVTAWS